ncbi:MAG TPA: ABC transporter substrate-binding protein [Stellaceae bacterium]|jgi:phospholipid transport system substrate-binding protein
MRRRSLLAVVPALFAIGLAAERARAATADAAAFMNDLLGQAIAVLNGKTSMAERRARFAQLFHADFDGPGIARFVLGRYWRTASPDERQEFLKLFDDYVVLVYSTRLADFSGQTFKVRGSRADADATIVSTDIVSPGAAQPIEIDWRLVGGDHGYKITDVVVGGVSMMVTERSEFASVIQRHGGQVQGLLALMREKTASAQ